jgi:hypothetical protein
VLLFVVISQAVICAIFAALIAPSKNRNPGSDAVIGLIFGIFGVLYVATRSKEPERPAQGRPEAVHQALASVQQSTDAKQALKTLRQALEDAGSNPQLLSEVEASARKVARDMPSTSATLDVVLLANHAQELAAAAPLALPAPPAEGQVGDALGIAQRRYAAGEISRDEYLQLENDLRGATPG